MTLSFFLQKCSTISVEFLNKVARNEQRQVHLETDSTLRAKGRNRTHAIAKRRSQAMAGRLALSIAATAPIVAGERAHLKQRMFQLLRRNTRELRNET